MMNELKEQYNVAVMNGWQEEADRILSRAVNMLEELNAPPEEDDE